MIRNLKKLFVLCALSLSGVFAAAEGAKPASFDHITDPLSNIHDFNPNENDFRKVSKQFNCAYCQSHGCEWAEAFAKHIVNNTNPPKELIENIKLTPPNSKEYFQEITASIIKEIIGNNGVLVRHNKPLPSWLRPYFKQLLPQQILPDAPDAIKHALTKKQFWIANETEYSEIDAIENSLYVDFNTIQAANQQQPLTTVPYKLIHITASDFNNSANRNFIETISQHNPTVTWVIDFENAITTGDYFGFNPANNQGFDSVRNISIYGPNLTSVSDYFLFDCSGLASLNLSPLSKVRSIDRHFLWDCSSLNSVITPDGSADAIFRNAISKSQKDMYYFTTPPTPYLHSNISVTTAPAAAMSASATAQ